MDNSQLKKITASFLDIEPLFAKKKKLLQDARQTRRKLKTKLNEYSFLKTLVGIDVKDEILEIAVKDCFDAFGFDKVECVGQAFKEEDLRVWYGNKLIIFEVTGQGKELPSHDKIFQIDRHVPIKKQQFKEYEVYGGFIVNHNCIKPFEQRHKRPFDEKVNILAKGSEITLLTTVDILNSFINFKTGKLTLYGFATQLCTPGVFKLLGT